MYVYMYACINMIMPCSFAVVMQESIGTATVLDVLNATTLPTSGVYWNITKSFDCILY